MQLFVDAGEYNIRTNTHNIRIFLNTTGTTGDQLAWSAKSSMSFCWPWGAVGTIGQCGVTRSACRFTSSVILNAKTEFAEKISEARRFQVPTERQRLAGVTRWYVITCAWQAPRDAQVLETGTRTKEA